MHTLQIGDDFVLAIEVPDEGDWFCLYSPIGDLPKSSVEEAFFVCQKALELNAFQGASRGGAIGLIPDQSQLIYSLVRGIKGCDEF
ncbi:MAG: CesT family type III secretion system chaperone [Chlamydiales bacterium]|nr:CesT family type III secretion system chaperone [Chlamydiales bacterium]